ncbi:MAG: signal peptide peptidase SppA, partial [Acidobacteria bacterium]|nr:signal peptide peptidase SppA [Acidobacteriota bacterium]
LAIIVSVGGMIALTLLVGREPAVSANSVLIVRVEGDLAETPSDTLLDGFVAARRPSLRTIVDNLRKAKTDTRITGVIVAPANLTSAYWAKLQEVRDAVIDFRSSGKKAVAYLEFGGDREYYLATGCERIFLMPTSPLNLSGLASYELFLRGTLDKIGAYPDFFHIGDYKTAPNQLTEKTFTPAHREMAESLNRDFFEQLVSGVAAGRKKSVEEIRGIVDGGPFLAEDAMHLGLIDDLAYEDQIDGKLQPKGGKVARVKGEDYARVSSSSSGYGSGPRIAVINAVGIINSGRSGYDPMNGAVAGSDTLVEYIRKAREDHSIKAVVLRVDSPGGSTIASDVIWRELTLVRTGTSARPLVVSMSDLAASGGYYIAMAAPDIVAEPGTLTGSIGIYGGKIVTGGTYEKLGMNIESLSIGTHADMNSPVRPYNEGDRAKLEEQLRAFYDQFIEKVAAARHMKPEAVDAIAQGRVWTGRQAQKLGLVDALGGLDRAVALAKERAKIPAKDRVELVVYPPRRSVWDAISEGLSGADQRLDLAALLGIGDRRAVAIVTAP